MRELLEYSATTAAYVLLLLFPALVTVQVMRDWRRLAPASRVMWLAFAALALGAFGFLTIELWRYALEGA